MNIKTVTIFGANGSMGAQTAGIIAAFGDATVYMASRDMHKSKTAVEIAIKAVRSDTLRKRLIPVDYENVSKPLSLSDWVLEAVSENIAVKEETNKIIAKTGKKGRIVTTTTSGLSVSGLAQEFGNADRSHYFGTHFFNPPYKMLLCEAVPTIYTNRDIFQKFTGYLQNVLHRVVIKTSDTPAFAANRIGFQLMNEAAQLAESYKHLGGAAYIDELLGRYTGRSMAPLATLDFVGLDTHRAIVDNLYDNTNDEAHETFMIPAFIEKLIARNKLGKKTKGGIYTRQNNEKGIAQPYVYDIETDTYIPRPRFHFPVVTESREFIHTGSYHHAIQSIVTSTSQEAEIVRYFIARYISYSFSMVGVVTEDIALIDRAMASGFGWLPPSGYVDFLGGTDHAIRLIKLSKLRVPGALRDYRVQRTMSTSTIDYRSLIKV